MARVTPNIENHHYTNIRFQQIWYIYSTMFADASRCSPDTSIIFTGVSLPPYYIFSFISAVWRLALYSYCSMKSILTSHNIYKHHLIPYHITAYPRWSIIRCLLYSSIIEVAEERRCLWGASPLYPLHGACNLIRATCDDHSSIEATCSDLRQEFRLTTTVAPNIEHIILWVLWLSQSHVWTCVGHSLIAANWMVPCQELCLTTTVAPISQYRKTMSSIPMTNHIANANSNVIRQAYDQISRTIIIRIYMYVNL